MHGKKYAFEWKNSAIFKLKLKTVLFCYQAEIFTAVRGHLELSFEYLIGLGKWYRHMKNNFFFRCTFLCTILLGRPLRWHFFEFILFLSNSWENFTLILCIILLNLLNKLTEKKTFSADIVSHYFQCAQLSCWLIPSSFDEFWLCLKKYFFSIFFWRV